MADEISDIVKVATYVQGQIFQLRSLPLLASRSRSMNPTAKKVAEGAAGSSPLLLVPIKVATEHVMLVTQTCDLQARNTERGRTVAHVAPVLELAGDPLKDARRDSRPNFIPVPWVNDVSFVDLDQMAAVDRGILAEALVVAGPSEADRRGLAYRLGRYFSRPALPNEVLEALRPLQKFAEAKHVATARVLSAIAQVRVSSSPSFADEGPWFLRVTLVVDEEWFSDVQAEPFAQTGKEIHDTTTPMVKIFDKAELAHRGHLLTLWGRLCEQLRVRLTCGLEERAKGKITDVLVEIKTSLTPDDLDNSDVLDFGHYSMH